jgi:hypothetical protein
MFIYLSVKLVYSRRCGEAPEGLEARRDGGECGTIAMEKSDYQKCVIVYTASFSQFFSAVLLRLKKVVVLEVVIEQI